MRIKLATIFVDDQDRARAFYSEMLGLSVKTDAAYGPDARWLTVVSPDDPDGTELLLAAAHDPVNKAFQEATRSAGRPATSLSTRHLESDYAQLSAAGVMFTTAPAVMPYGGMDAVFDDTCGNLINLHQE